MSKIFIVLFTLANFSIFADEVKCKQTFTHHNIETVSNQLSRGKDVKSLTITEMKDKDGLGSDYLICVVSKKEL